MTALPSTVTVTVTAPPAVATPQLALAVAARAAYADRGCVIRRRFSQ